MAELDRVGDDLALGITLDELEAPVRIQRRTNVEPSLARKSHERRVAGLAWISTRQPTGPSGVLLTSQEQRIDLAN